MKKTLKSTQVRSSRPKKVAESNDYLASIKILGKKYEAKGATAHEAIGNLKVGGFVKSMSVLEIVHGEVRKSRVFPPLQTARLFSPSPMMREIAIKNVSIMYQGI